MLSGKVPFERASRSVINYRLIMNRQWGKYWEKLDRYNVFPNGVSDEFKDLFMQMVAYNPNERPSVAEILTHPWLQLRNATMEETLAEFNVRDQAIVQENVSPAVSEDNDTNAVYRGEGDSCKYFTEAQKQFEDEYIVSKQNAVIINGDVKKPYELLSKFASLTKEKLKSSIKCDDKNLKFSIVIENEIEQEEEEEAEDEVETEPLIISVRYNYSTKDKLCFLNFMKDSGSMFDYVEKVKMLKEIAKEL